MLSHIATERAIGCSRSQAAIVTTQTTRQMLWQLPSWLTISWVCSITGLCWVVVPDG